MSEKSEYSDKDFNPDDYDDLDSDDSFEDDDGVNNVKKDNVQTNLLFDFFLNRYIKIKCIKNFREKMRKIILQ